MRCSRRCLALFVILLAQGVAAQPMIGGRGGAAPRPPRFLMTQIPSEAAGEAGVSVAVFAPDVPRFPEGAPVVIHVQGGHDAGRPGSDGRAVPLGFVEVSFAFPASTPDGGPYDYRGPNSVRALADVTRFATGEIRDRAGHSLDELVEGMPVLTSNVGLMGGSHGGNACGAAMGLHGEEFPKLAWYVSFESPYGEGAAGAELGWRGGRLCPAYDPETGELDLGPLAFDEELRVLAMGRPVLGQPAVRGGLYFDMNGDGKYSFPADYAPQCLVFDLGDGPKAWYSLRLLRAAHERGLFGEEPPEHIPSVEEAEEFWRTRDATGLIPDAVQKLPELRVTVVANETDHVQIAPDHPHIRAQVDAFSDAGAAFVRLNPDRAYVEWVLRSQCPEAPDNPAGQAYGPTTIQAALCPDTANIGRALIPAALCELADRTRADESAPDLDTVIYTNTPRRTGAMGAFRMESGGLGIGGSPPGRR